MRRESVEMQTPGQGLETAPTSDEWKAWCRKTCCSQKAKVINCFQNNNIRKSALKNYVGNSVLAWFKVSCLHSICLQTNLNQKYKLDKKCSVCSFLYSKESGSKRVLKTL